MSILKSKNDNCKYYTFKLINDLNVFVVEDIDANIACATMLVKIGYKDDTVMGIAHFLEHMLFQGTQKYPNETDWWNFINKNGGHSNAFTSHDHTCYYYTVHHESLIESLDMFGDFFINPLLKKDSIHREIEAVNSEHSKNMLSDEWRIHEIKKKAFDKKNTIKNFGTGCKKTLKIPNIDKIVKDFFNDNYSANIMTLLIVTNNNFENIKNKITEVFSNIKNTNKIITNYDIIYD